MTVTRKPCSLGIERCSPRNLAEQIHCVARHSDISAKELAERIGVPYDWFVKRTSDSGRAEAPTWLMVALAIHTGRTDHIQAEAHSAGLVCYEVPKGTTPTDKQTADVLREFGEWLTVMATRIGDGIVSEDDIVAIAKEWHEHLNVGSALMDTLKARVERPRPQIVGGAR
jgi:hypothetical protein